MTSDVKTPDDFVTQGSDLPLVPVPMSIIRKMRALAQLLDDGLQPKGQEMYLLVDEDTIYRLYQILVAIAGKK